MDFSSLGVKYNPLDMLKGKDGLAQQSIFGGSMNGSAGGVFGQISQ